MKKLKKYGVIVFVFIFIIFIFIFSEKVNVDIKADKGILNISDWNFNQNGKIKLEGEWDLFYGELLMPEDIKTRVANNYYNIPGKLREQVDGKTQGYMTLHLIINVPKDEIYGIYFNSLFTASDIWINGIYSDGHGKVGKDNKNEKAIYRPQYIYFTSINRKIDIVIQTSTFRDLEPSLGGATFGTKYQIMKSLYKNVCMDGVIIGIMFIMGILNFGFYFTKRKQKRNLYFASICFILIMRCLVLNNRLLVQFYPNMNYEVLSKIAAITVYISVVFYILFLNDVFENRIKIKKLVLAFGIVFTSICMGTNNRVYDGIAIYMQGMIVIFAIYLFIFMSKEIRRGNKNAQKYFFTFIIICITGLNDILVNNSVIHSQYFVQYGFIVFIGIQSIVMVNEYLEKHKKIENINRDGLTSLYNNKHIKELLERSLLKYRERNEKFSVMMIDIDDFKNINDTMGHMFGDAIIIDVANILKEVVDAIGHAGRFGGDEFVIILPKTNEKDAFLMASIVMKKIKKLNNKYKINFKISISIGVYENDVEDLTQCVNNVDNLLYKAKGLGKNCISV